ncbi:hypothetical protein BG259_27835 (plasmid) [Vibrio harveyi]|nr:hypothetical protein BG259_27835 [Vibrio harveyi]
MKNSVDMQMIMIIIKTSIMKSPDEMIDTTFAHITSSVIIKLIFKGHMPFISLASGAHNHAAFSFFSRAIFPKHGDRS